MTSALTSFYRSLTRHKLFAALNIGGLALGIAVFLVLSLFVRFETGFDRWIPGADQLYIIQEHYHMPGYPETPNPNTMGNELLQLRADYPQLQGTRIAAMDATVRQGTVNTREALAAVDPNFFQLLHLPVVAGDPTRTLADPDGIVITQRAATSYFGQLSPIGRTLTVVANGTPYTYRVGAVIADMRKDMSYTSELFVPLVASRFATEWFDHWGSTSLVTLLRFPDRAAAHRFEGELARFAERRVFGDNLKKGQWEQSLRPLVDNHLYAASDRAVVTTLGAVGVLTLLIAIVNYINLATARAGLRAREVAVRKVLGGTRRALTRQFLTEAMLTVILSAVIGLALAEIALPLINTLGGMALRIDYWGANSVLLLLVPLVLAVGAVAGLYPAAVLAGFRPAAVLAAARAPGGGRVGARVRAGLVVVQFSIAIAFAIGTTVMLAQASHVRDADLGFRREGLYVVRSLNSGSVLPEQKTALMRAFAALPGVSDVTMAQNAPGDQSLTNFSTMYQPGMQGIRAPSLMDVRVGDHYFDTFGARLVAGRLFNRSRPADDRALRAKGSTTPFNVVINRMAVGLLGFASPQAAIGKPIEGDASMTIIGVVDDLRFLGPRQAISGTFYRLDTRPLNDAFITLRYSGDPQKMADAVEAAWKRIVPTEPFEGRTIEENLYKAYYEQDTRRGRLFTMGAVLAIAIGCIGLYGLAAFDTTRRIKEIGIRKALGASTRDVLQLLVAKFLRPVLLANLIAWPLAWVAMQRWLSTFDDRIALTPWYFLAASALAVAIAVLTVLGQSWRVARAEPARALRYE
ncbi:transporter [Sphingomonas sp. ABOLE]|uniref:ABC transporter permease n=1 Tax=Sphingomonas sp. ABOLE TaxID=1985878 RepID=UPI000F7E7AE1|nr:ABC transporter permease [Sphingomonas sp. ABOLE]RSV40688.1 transporter [Sphingomonas sp. ABOLE]